MTSNQSLTSSSSRAAAAIVIAIVAVTSTGCSNAPASTGSGNSGGGNNSTAREKAVKFAECMRNNGVSSFPDPDASGALTIDGVLNGSSLDPNSAAWKRAIDACKDLEPPGFTGSTATAAQMKGRLKFAQCIRDNGVKDFPDPTKDGPLVDTNRIPSTATTGGMNALNAAMRACRSLGAVAGVSQP